MDVAPASLWSPGQLLGPDPSPVPTYPGSGLAAGTHPREPGPGGDQALPTVSPSGLTQGLCGEATALRPGPGHKADGHQPAALLPERGALRVDVEWLSGEA